ncbi:MAG: FmdB family zinc ribbon protein [Candidatus Limnocylindrales bacterium]
MRHAHAPLLTWGSSLPIYDYICANCRTLTEVIHGIHDPGPRFCPSCGADGTMRKALSTPTVHFKGSGWAKKDRSSTGAARTKAGASSTSNDGASGDRSSSGDSSSDGGKSADTPAPDKGKAASEPAKTSSAEPAAHKED